MSTLDKNLLLEMFRKMEEIRRMDFKNRSVSEKGESSRTTTFLSERKLLTSERCRFNPDDLITSNHRGHGQAS